MAKMPEGTLLRAGVAGAGVFGGIHAQKYEASNDAELTAVYGPDEERSQIRDEHICAFNQRQSRFKTRWRAQIQEN